jgi:hypothetical protein
MKLNSTEVEKVSLLDPIKRYHYFLKRVADNELMYTLIDKEGNYAISRIEDQYMLPLWSSIEFVELCLINGWGKYVIKEISLNDFEEEITDYISDKNYLINVFPVYEKTGFILDLEEFSRDLSEELENYE